MDKFVQTYLSLLIYIVLYFNSSEHVFCYGSEGNYLNHVVRLLTNNSPNDAGGSTFNVKSFGARGDGVTDDSKAFQAAMAKACTVNGGVMLVPSGSTFLLQTTKFDGSNCQPGITVQIEGNIVAPRTVPKWKFINFEWILFNEFVRGITIEGNGTIDARGKAWWPFFQGSDSDDEENYRRPRRPHAIRIASSNNVTVTGIRIQNPPFFHIFIDLCQQVTIFDFSVSSPGKSPNTDGIHLSRTQHVVIHNATLACGDDCISIQRGCSDVRIYDVHCGPGHGYSIGSLGFKKEEAQVSDIIVYDSTVKNSLNGVRIKTWQGVVGFAKNVTFSNIVMSNVKTPIVIDQKYCGGKQGCSSKNKSAVAISGVTYENIRGTFTSKPVSLMCSEYVPCRSITMATIDLKPSNITQGKPLCTNAYGRVLTNTTPPLTNCLLPGVRNSAS